MKYLNGIILVVLSLIYFTFSSQIKFSTNFLDIFLSQESIKLFDVAKKLGATEEILIAKKGFDENSLDELYNIKKELEKLSEITKVELKQSSSKQLKKYLIKNYYLLSNFDNTPLKQKDIKQKLQNIYDELHNSPIYEPINVYDPLELFSLNEMQHQKYVKLKNYGYVLKAQTSVNTSSAKDSRELYNKVNKVLEKYIDVIAIAPFFYLVENSAYIKSDAQMIMLISSLFLIILYFIILKNHKLFFNTIITIGSSILSAILLTSFMFDSISILALVFGISITTISVDYMFHYYFHDNFVKKKFINNKRVLFGFITTFGVFIIFSFIDIALFSQLAVFSAVSLSVAYVLFSYLYGYLDIKPATIKKSGQARRGFKPLHVVIISLLMLGYAYENLEFDNNLKNLDYQNQKLINLSKKFNEGLENINYQKVLINAKSKEELLQRYEKLLNKHPSMLGIGKFVYSDKKCNSKKQEIKNYDFDNLHISRYAKEIGFKNVFVNAYKGVQNLECNMKILDEMKFKVIKNEDIFYTIALISPDEVIENSLHVKIVDLGVTLSSDTKVMKDTLVNYILMSSIFIVCILFYIAGKNILFPLMYLLFPISSVLFAITLFSKINIMHMFALVILLAISIDYGIYLHNTTTTSKTKTAIKYALLSTICGFGVLIFSSTVALYSIGFVISVGVGAIFLLLYASL